MRIRPHERLWHIDLGEIWRYRDLIELFVRRWKIQSELTPRANVSLTPENFLILTP